MRIMLAAALLLGACGGSDAPTEEPIDDGVATTGGEVAAEPEPELEEPEPEPTGPGQLRVAVTVGGQAAESATVRVMDESGETVAEGAPGDTFSVDSGSYRVAASIGDAALLADTPTRELDGMANVRPGDTAEVNIVALRLTPPSPLARVPLRRSHSASSSLRCPTPPCTRVWASGVKYRPGCAASA